MAEVGIFVGTVYGNALLVAEEAEVILKKHNHKVFIFEYPKLDDWLYYQNHYALVVTSTTGQGDLPENIIPLYCAIKEQVGFQPELKYGLIALGDSNYEHFCGGGQQFDALLQEQRAKRVGDMLMIDVSENPEPEVISEPWVEQWASLIS